MSAAGRPATALGGGEGRGSLVCVQCALGATQPSFARASAFTTLPRAFCLLFSSLGQRVDPVSPPACSVHGGPAHMTPSEGIIKVAVVAGSLLTAGSIFLGLDVAGSEISYGALLLTTRQRERVRVHGSSHARCRTPGTRPAMHVDSGRHGLASALSAHVAGPAGVTHHNQCPMFFAVPPALPARRPPSYLRRSPQAERLPVYASADKGRQQHGGRDHGRHDLRCGHI